MCKIPAHYFLVLGGMYHPIPASSDQPGISTGRAWENPDSELQSFSFHVSQDRRKEPLHTKLSWAEAFCNEGLGNPRPETLKQGWVMPWVLKQPGHR